MPAVTESTMIDSKGEIVTDFFDSVGTTSVNYTYNNTQTSLFFRNESDVSITVTVNASPTVVARYSESTITAEFTSFSVQSASGMAAFYARTIRGVTANNVSSTSLNVISGSATTPSISPIGDANTGIYFPAAETIGLTTNGTVKAVIDTNGNLGMGLTNPSNKIHLYQANTNQQYISISNQTSTILVGQDSSGNFNNYSNQAVSYIWSNSGTPKMRLDTNGNLGIGTASPAEPLHVEGNIYLGTSSRTIYTAGSGNLTIQSNTGNVRLATSGGNTILTAASASIDAGATTKPTINNTYDLGSSTLRWATIYSQNALNVSDARLKTDVQDSTLGLDFISNLRPVQYKFIEGRNEVTTDENGEQIITPIPGVRTHFGLIAQEVKNALPTDLDFAGWCLADKEDSTSTQSLGYTELIAPMIKAIQELKAEIESLKAQLNA